MFLNKFLDPKNNYAFQRIFGTEKNKDILIHFLNDILMCDHRAPVVDVTFLKTIQDPEIAAQKVSIVDILCTDQSGHHYVVEMQIAYEKGFEKRAQYYAAKAYTSQLLVGGKYHELKEVIFLAIADFVMFPNKKSYRSNHVILDQESHEHDLKDFSFTFLELPKFTKTFDELSNSVEQWMYFFKHAPDTSEEDFAKLSSYPIIERAYKELNRFSWNEQELRTYDQAEKYEGAYQASMEHQFDKGLEKGREETQHAIARSLLKRGLSADFVSETTGIPLNLIHTIKST